MAIRIFCDRCDTRIPYGETRSFSAKVTVGVSPTAPAEWGIKLDLCKGCSSKAEAAITDTLAAVGSDHAG